MPPARSPCQGGGDGPSGAGFLVLAAVGVALLALLLYFIGR